MTAAVSAAPELVLASQSASRRAMLAAAGVPHHSVSPAIDEEAFNNHVAESVHTIFEKTYPGDIDEINVSSPVNMTYKIKKIKYEIG